MQYLIVLTHTSKICRTICRSKSELSLNHEKTHRKNRFSKRFATLFRRLLRSPDSLTSLHLTHVGSHTYRLENKPLVAFWRSNCEVIGRPRRSIDTVLTSCGYIRPFPDSVWTFGTRYPRYSKLDGVCVGPQRWGRGGVRVRNESAMAKA